MCRLYSVVAYPVASHESLTYVCYLTSLSFGMVMPYFQNRIQQNATSGTLEETKDVNFVLKIF